jgi:hypothetical protein
MTAKASIEDRIAARTREINARAEALPPGAERDKLIRRVRQAETALHMQDWLNSPGLRSPK